MSTTSRAPALALGPHQALIAVCLLHAVSPYLFRGAHPGYGWDETVYISQIDPHTVAGYFSAPRARGMTLLTAPAALLTPSVLLMRAWLAVLSGIGLYAAFRPWLRLDRGWAVPIAALLWSGIWIDIYYGYMAMPNQWIAYCAVAACGWLLVARDRTVRRAACAWLAVWLALAALVRPSDSLAIVAPLVAFVVIDRGWDRRGRLVVSAVMLGSVAAGWSEWIVEAFDRFGGVGARLHAASVENGGAGLHWELGAEFRALAGPLLCRYHCTASAPALDRIWWCAIPGLVALGLLAGGRRRRGTVRMDLLCCVVAVIVGLEYVVLIGYAAPRFLAPSYALLAIPIAEGAVWAVGAARGRGRQIAVATALIAVLGVQEVGQARIVSAVTAADRAGNTRSMQLAAFLRSHRVGAPCAIAGLTAGPTSFRLGCFGIDTIRWAPIAQELVHGGRSTVVIIFDQPPPRATFYAGWRRLVFEPPGHATWLVWIKRPGRSSRRETSGGAAMRQVVEQPQRAEQLASLGGGRGAVAYREGGFPPLLRRQRCQGEVGQQRLAAGLA